YGIEVATEHINTVRSTSYGLHRTDSSVQEFRTPCGGTFAHQPEEKWGPAAATGPRPARRPDPKTRRPTGAWFELAARNGRPSRACCTSKTPARKKCGRSGSMIAPKQSQMLHRTGDDGANVAAGRHTSRITSDDPP